MSKRGFRHAFMRHGVWGEARGVPPLNEFGPGALMGLLRLMAWDGDPDAVKREIRALTKNELRLLVAFAYVWGSSVEGYREVKRWARKSAGRPHQRREGPTEC